MTAEATPKPHLGRNIRHFRQENDLKQDELADLMGDPWTQKKISQLEAKATIDDGTLEQVAQALKVSVEDIKDFSEEPVANKIIQYNYEGSNNQGANVANNNFQCSFNPLDKVMEAHEDVKRLYEALLKEKDEKIALLNKMLEDEQ